MILTPYLASIKYKGIVDTEIDINISTSGGSDIGARIVELTAENVTFLPIESYKEGTLLDADEGIVIRTHYQHHNATTDNTEFYDLAFQIYDENYAIKNYKIIKRQMGFTENSIEFKYSNDMDIFYIPKRYKYVSSKNHFIPLSNGDSSYNTAGRYIIDIFLGDKLVKEIPVLVLPSGMSYKDYIRMVEDIINIREDIIINSSSNVGLFKKWDTKISLIEDCIKNITKPLNYINKSPHNTLINEDVLLPYNKIKKFNEKIILEKTLFPHKNKFLTSQLKESSCILEHDIIKSSLIDINNKLKNYIKNYKEDIYNEETTLKKVITQVENNIKKPINEEKDNLKLKLEKVYDYYKTYQNNDPVTAIRGKHISINFLFTKILDINCCDIKLTLMDGVFILEVDSSWNADKKSWGLDLHFGSYYYHHIGSNIYKNGKFNGRRLRLCFQTTNIHEIIFLTNAISNIQKGDDLQLDANIYINSSDINDPIGGKHLSWYGQREVKDFIINILSINNINGISPVHYSDKVVKNFLETYVLIDENDTLGFLESISFKQNYYDLLNKNNYYELIDKIDVLLKKPILAQAKYKSGQLKPTQIFNNDINYRNIYKHLNSLNKDINFTTEYNKNAILLKSTCDIYELWCLYKLVDLFINELGFTLLNKDKVLDDLNNITNIKNIKNKKLDKILTVDLIKVLPHPNCDDEFDDGFKAFDFNYKFDTFNDFDYELDDFDDMDNLDDISDNINNSLDNDLNATNCIKVSISYEEKINLSKNKYKTPDYKITISYNGKIKIFYLDAKYRNYTDLGMKCFTDDIKSVAIEKYIVPFINTENMPTASMILHSHNHQKYSYLGGDIETLKSINKFYMEQHGVQLPPHSFGGFYVLPSDVNYLRLYIRLLFEYHFNKYEICWSCGEVLKVNKTLKKTKGGNDKYHYTCSNCNEFWVKNHCKNSLNHKIIKHITNYHINKQRSYPWYLYCPECGD